MSIERDPKRVILEWGSLPRRWGGSAARGGPLMS